MALHVTFEETGWVLFNDPKVDKGELDPGLCEPSSGRIRDPCAYSVPEV